MNDYFKSNKDLDKSIHQLLDIDECAIDCDCSERWETSLGKQVYTLGEVWGNLKMEIWLALPSWLRRILS